MAMLGCRNTDNNKLALPPWCKWAASRPPFLFVLEPYIVGECIMCREEGLCMDDEEVMSAYSESSGESDQIKYARRWIAELKGKNREKAIELMKKVADCELTSEEAIQLLDVEKA